MAKAFATLPPGRSQANRRRAGRCAQLMSARQANLLGALACGGLLAYAYYAQFVMHLEPCPLCIFQRIGMLMIALVFAIAAAHDPAGWPRRLYAGLLALAALATVGVAGRQLYIQS